MPFHCLLDTIEYRIAKGGYSMGEEVSILIAFGAGFLSFISPCVLPLYPAFLSYITGMSVNELKNDNNKINKNSIIHTIIFLVGFSLVFIMLGFSTSIFSKYLLMYQGLIRQIGSIVIIFFGLVIVGIFNFEFLMKDRSISFKNRPTGYIGSFLIGLAFSMGWTPCMGPILVIVLSMAAQDPSQGLIVMIAYVLGFAIPFLLLSFFVGKMTWIRKHSAKLVKIGGYIMIFFGILLFFDFMTKFTSLLAEWTGFKGF